MERIRIVYTFEPEEVAEDLFLVRSIEFNKTDSELFEGKIVLKFENKGDTPIEYTHIEEIPKSFAESVDDLVFSIPPDEIIDPDPKVMWKGLKNITGTILIGYMCTGNFFNAMKVYCALLDRCVADCNKLSGKSKDYCLLLLAEELKVAEPIEVCYEIESEDCKNLCLGRVTGDKEYCDKIKDEDLRKLCLGEEEEKPPDVTICESIEYQFDRDMCYFDLAKEKLDGSICDLIQNRTWRWNCYYFVALSKEDDSVCDLMQDDEYDDNEIHHCNYLVAVKAKDISICDKLPETVSHSYSFMERYNCYMEIAEYKQDASICAQIPDEWSDDKDRCYKKVAIRKQDASFCGEIKNHYSKDYCYKAVAKLKQDASICGQIQDQLIRDACYSEVPNKP